MASLDQSKRIVVKIGSALLVDSETGDLRADWLRGLMSDIADQKTMGKDIVIVSSGSIAMGRRVLNLSDDELSLEQSQAAAAVGQIRLAQAYEGALSPLGIKTAQILLTLEDSSDRRRYLNSRGTLRALLDLNVVPIVNENDTVATDEIRFGDNDRLAAQVASMAGADMLVLLSDVDGLYTANPREDNKAQHIGIIDKITPELEAGAGGAGSGLSRGGMKTKIMAAKTAMASGCAMIIMEGDVDRPLKALNQGVKHSLFKADQNPKDARKSWIAAMKPKANVTIDDGAIAALESGKSLLAVGVIGVDGQFTRGDPVVIQNKEGGELAKGLVNYDANEAVLIMGAKTSEIEDKLGYPGRGALVHRDDLVV